MERVLEFAEALEVVLGEARKVSPGGTERVAVLDALGRALAEDVIADRDQPPFDRSTRDGFAMRAADAGRELRLLGQVRAGEWWRGQPVAEGEAVEIMTGAPVPEGADCVAMVEHVLAATNQVKLAEGRTIRSGENIVPRGAEARAGDVIVPAGQRLGAAEIAAAASLGYSELAVARRPRVAILATGDELVEVDRQPDAWQIRNSNSYGLAALVMEEDALAERLEIARDTAEDVERLVARGAEHDLLVVSGGVSMGKYDVVEQVLAAAGADFFFTGALIQPGKPVVFGRLPRPSGGWAYFFGLPGNPVSTQVTFRLFVAPLLRALSGQARLAPTFAEAKLVTAVKGGAKVTRFLPAELRSAWDHASVEAVRWQGSGDLAANARANSYLMLPAGVDHFPAGSTVRVLLR